MGKEYVCTAKQGMKTLRSQQCLEELWAQSSAWIFIQVQPWLQFHLRQENKWCLQCEKKLPFRYILLSLFLLECIFLCNLVICFFLCNLFMVLVLQCSLYVLLKTNMPMSIPIFVPPRLAILGKYTIKVMWSCTWMLSEKTSIHISCIGLDDVWHACPTHISQVPDASGMVLFY